MMKRFIKRIEKLEARAFPPDWSNVFAEIQQCALNKLSEEDRGLIQEYNGSQRIDFGGALWSRWEEAFNHAVLERKVPFSLTAPDLFF